ncbi:hypothetical protein [Epilithonimonas sp.]|uniref:hypothetical protein n=1 Tax=Epilithonimonas sp. TaxID=2894511 RepID=UPI0035B369E2
MAKSSYITKKRTEINFAVEFAIEEHLAVLNSDIILPEKKNKVNEIRLLPTVKSREIVYNNLISLLDNPDISESIKNKSEKKTIAGLKKTMEELIEKIIKRPMRVDQMVKDFVDDKFPDFEVEETSDDIISSISNAVKVAIDLVISIKDKIAVLEDPETHKKEKIDNEIIPSIAERYAIN